MERYRNRHGGAEILGYEVGEDTLSVLHRNGWIYEYTLQSAGAEVLKTLNRLARAGSGLSRYITQHAHSSHARRYRQP